MFENSAQGLEQELNKAQSNTQEEPTRESASPKENLTPSEVLELEKIDKFRYGGKEWTPKELERAMLRQRDYTQKTMQLSEERKAFASDQKYYDNLAYDIQHVLTNPSLAIQFKAVYPEKFHKYLDTILDNQPRSGGESRQTIPKELASEIATLKRGLGEYQNYMQEQAVQSASKQLDAICAKYSSKYPLAKEREVLATAQVMIDQRKVDNLSDKEWENLFKAVHEENKKQWSGFQENLVKEQINANKKGKEGARGGGISGSAPKRLTFKEATQAAIRDLTR